MDPESPCLPLIARKYVLFYDSRTAGLLPCEAIISHFLKIVHKKFLRNFDKVKNSFRNMRKSGCSIG